MSDYAGGLLLSDAEIDRERGIILSEKRASDSVGFRTFVARLEAMLGETTLARRLPIGTEQVLANAPRERFLICGTRGTGRNAWRWSWWAISSIHRDREAGHRCFAGLQARAPARAEPSLGKLPKFTGVRPFYHREPRRPRPISCLRP
jgi:zinc protease